MQNRDKSLRTNMFLMGTAGFLAYGACYAGRSILSAVVPQMLLSTTFTRADFGLMASAFFLTYGIGQIINGIMGDKINPKYMVSVGLIFAGFGIAAFPFINSVSEGVMLWGLCGFSLSMLWGPLTKTFAENAIDKTARILITSLSVSAIVGSLAAFTIATTVSALDKWEPAFFITGGLPIVASIIWFVIIHGLEKKKVIKPVDRSIKRKLDKQTLYHMLGQGVLFMFMVSMINGIVRNAVSFWIPSYLNEKLGYEPAVSAGISGILPFVNLLGTFTGILLLRKLRYQEFRTITYLFFSSVFMFLFAFLSSDNYKALTVVLIFVGCATMSSASNVIFSAYCLRFKATGFISTITGLLNFGAYAASSGASALFSFTISRGGWDMTVLLWSSLALIGALAALIARGRYDYPYSQT